MQQLEKNAYFFWKGDIGSIDDNKKWGDLESWYIYVILHVPRSPPFDYHVLRSMGPCHKLGQLNIDIIREVW